MEEKSINDRFEKAETLLNVHLEGRKSQKASSVSKVTAEKVVRDSFTMPQADYDLIDSLKKKSLQSGIQVTKSEILRAGLLALDQMKINEFLRKIETVEKIKTGRPKLNSESSIVNSKRS